MKTKNIECEVCGRINLKKDNTFCEFYFNNTEQTTYICESCMNKLKTDASDNSN